MVGNFRQKFSFSQNDENSTISINGDFGLLNQVGRLILDESMIHC